MRARTVSADGRRSVACSTASSSVFILSPLGVGRDVIIAGEPVMCIVMAAERRNIPQVSDSNGPVRLRPCDRLV